MHSDLFPLALAITAMSLFFAFMCKAADWLYGSPMSAATESIRRRRERPWEVEG